MSILSYDVAVSPSLDFSNTAGPLNRRVRNRKFYQVSFEDPAIRNETEGGYIFTRPRFRRFPLRRSYTFGYTDLSPQQLQVLENFWNSVQGGSYAFTWIDYDGFWAEFPNLNGQAAVGQEIVDFTRTVRFAGPFKPKTMNMGHITRYNVEDITLREV